MVFLSLLSNVEKRRKDSQQEKLEWEGCEEIRESLE